MPDYDVVVIGAGNGGLTSVVSLAGKGLKVLLLERHNIPGGCATSFVRGRFEFEVALHQLSGMGTKDNPGPLRTLFDQSGVLDKLEFVEMDNLYRVVIPNKLDITLNAERSKAIETLKKRFPKEKDSIEKFFELVYDFCMQLITGIVFRDPEISKKKYPLYFKYALSPSREILDKFFNDLLLKTTISAYWTYMGLPPNQLSFTDLAMVIFQYLELKPFHIKGGSQALSNAFLDTFIQRGGDTKFSCGVDKILVSNGKVTAVITEDGDEITTDYVVSNAGPLTTYVDLIDKKHVPSNQLKAIGTRTIGPSAFTVYIGFDCEPEDMGIQEATNFIFTSDDFDRTYALSKTLEQAESVLFTCYDVSDPDFSPLGTCQAALVTLQYAEPWLHVPPSQYADAKYNYASGLLDVAEKVFPEIRNHIEECEVATPLTHMRYLGHPGGAIYGFDQHAKDSALFIERKSPIRGLYFAGAWMGSGGFQPTLNSGAGAAQAILRTINK